MGTRYTYQTRDYLAVEEVMLLLERAPRAFQRFFSFSLSEKQVVCLHPAGPLPPWYALHGLTLGNVTFTGTLPAAPDPRDTGKAILRHGGMTIGAIGLLEVEMAFMREPLPYAPEKADHLGVAFWKGQPYVTYCASTAQVSFDLRERREFYQQLIRQARLPIRLSVMDGYFNLYHTAQGDLSIGQATGYSGENPGLFRCEMPGARSDELVDRLARVLPALVHPQPITYCWLATTALPGRKISEAPPSYSLYSKVAHAGYPMDALEISMEVALHKPIGLETLRRFCGPRETLEIYCGQGMLNDEVSVDLYVLVTPAGHTVRLATDFPLEIASIGRAWGTTLVEGVLPA